MEWLTVGLLLAVLGVLIYLISTRNQAPEETQGMLLLQQRIQELEKSLEGKLGEGTNRMFESMRSQFNESQRLASDIRDLVAKQLTEVRIEQTKTPGYERNLRVILCPYLKGKIKRQTDNPEYRPDKIRCLRHGLMSLDLYHIISGPGVTEQAVLKRHGLLRVAL